MSIISEFFENAEFIPHGFCLTWRPDIFWMQVASDGAIALSYFAIPCVLLYFYCHQNKVRFDWLLILFGLFIVLCGLTHVMDIWTLWRPDYAVQALVKLMTALVSLFTAVVLFVIMPKAMALPTVHDLELKNAQLLEETRIREKTEADLRSSQNKLKAITDSLFEGVLVVDGDGTITFSNPSAIKLLEDDANGPRLEGLSIDKVAQLSDAPDDNRKVDKLWWCTDRGITIRLDDVRLLAPTGKLLDVAIACAPLEGDIDAGSSVISFRNMGNQDWPGKKQGTVISFRDIGEVKQAQREAFQTSRLASV